MTLIILFKAFGYLDRRDIYNISNLVVFLASLVNANPETSCAHYIRYLRFHSYPSDSELLAPGGIFRPEISVRHCHDL